jgi:dihydroorotase
MKTLIKNITYVNEGKSVIGDILIHNERIEKIATNISISSIEKYKEIDGTGKFLIPGVIDDQVHFRDPGLTHKATIESESKAAVAGGVTSFMDMPNTIPNTLTQELLEEKYAYAKNHSLANYSFFMGITQHNLEEALKTDKEWVCGITDDGLYFNNNSILANHPEFVEKLFSSTDHLIALHSENEARIEENYLKFKKIYGEDIPVKFHGEIRDEIACLESTKTLLNLAISTDARLHLFHVSTGREALLLDNQTPLRNKNITAEACVHHLWFNDTDYERLGSKIKWNPSIKTESNRVLLFDTLINDHIDIIASDHAPHLLSEKIGPYSKMMSGAPMVQHNLPCMLEFYKDGKISIETIVQKMCHGPAEIYRMIDRGYIREGYFADLVIIDTYQTSSTPLYYKCGWGPMENYTFRTKIEKTFVNGHLVYENELFPSENKGMRLQFEKERK